MLLELYQLKVQNGVGKLGFNQYEEAKNNLLKLESFMIKPPSFKAIIIGNANSVMYDKENDIYSFPITALKP